MAKDYFDLAGKVALVTGASRGIGRAIVLALAQAGADIIAVSRTRSLLEELAPQVSGLGREILLVTADISDISDIPRVVEQGLDRFGHIDILVNNAGVARVEPVAEVTESTWDWIMSVNLKAAFFLAQAVGESMVQQGSGKIINIGSEAGLLGLPNHAAYSASKGGLIALTRALAAEWGEHNIQVNTLSPGSARTEMTLPAFEAPGGKEAMLGRMLIKRLCEPEEIAQAVVYLASDAANMVTGQVICVDGGSTAI